MPHAPFHRVDVVEREDPGGLRGDVEVVRQDDLVELGDDAAGASAKPSRSAASDHTFE